MWKKVKGKTIAFRFFRSEVLKLYYFHSEDTFGLFKKKIESIYKEDNGFSVNSKSKTIRDGEKIGDLLNQNEISLYRP